MVSPTVSSTAQAVPPTRGNVEDTIQLERANPQQEPKITEQWIEGMVSQGKQRFGKFWRKCRTADEFIRGDFDFPVTEDGSKVRLGTAHSVVKTLVDHITPPFVDITVPPPGARGQARAEKIEKFLRGSNHPPPDASSTSTPPLMALRGRKPSSSGLGGLTSQSHLKTLVTCRDIKKNSKRLWINGR